MKDTRVVLSSVFEANNRMKLVSRLVTALALADDAIASGLASKARAKPVTASVERKTNSEQEGRS